MEKLSLLLLFSFSSPLMAAPFYTGPLGDEWTMFHTTTVSAPLSLNSSLVIRTDKLILESSIVTNGHPLDIEAREIEVRNGAQIIAFSTPRPGIGALPQVPINNGTTGTYPGGDGGTGANGEIGLNGLDGRMDPAPISVKSLLVDGLLDINADGEQGGKGGKGGPGGKGGKGGDGQDGWAKIGWSCNGKGDDGTPGGDGGAGGLGGKGGKGGKGGANVGLALLLPQTSVSFSSQAGKGGLGGGPGDVGPSGDIGIGGKGGSDKFEWELGLKVYSCSHSTRAGRNGDQLVRNETAEQRNRRFGEEGEQYNSKLNEVVNQSANKLVEQKQLVLADAFSFHYARLFRTLLQDSLRIIAQQEITRANLEGTNLQVASLLRSANYQMIDQLLVSWSRHFIDQINGHSEFSHYKTSAEELLKVLTALKSVEVNTAVVNQQVNALITSADKLVKTKIRSLSLQCQKFNEILLENSVAIEFGAIQTPVCTQEAIAELMKKPRRPLVVNLRVEKGVFGDLADSSSIKVQESEVTQERRVAQALNEVIILYNRTYTGKDFQRARPDTQDGTQLGEMISYQVPSEEKVDFVTLTELIKGLGFGARVK